jgi:C-terminal processing protease CtpA/Prc
MPWQGCAARRARSIKLTVYRPGRDEPFDVTVTRAVITLEPVTGKLEGNVGGDHGQRVQP